MTATLAIGRVVVHRDGALVERSGRLTVTGGRAVIGGLPLLLDERSVRVEVEGGRLLGVGLDLDVLGEERGPEGEAKMAFDEAERALRALELERQALEAERQGHAAIVPASPPEEPDKVPSPSTLRAWSDLQDALSAWTAEIDDRLRALDRRLRDAREELARRGWALDQASTEAAWRRWQPLRRAVLRLAGDGEIEVKLSYRVPGATWSPAYALHADDGFRSGRLVVRALVAQSTGEDWRGVKLALSSASSRRAVALPELKAWKLGAAQAASKAWRDLPADLDALFPDDLASWRPAPPPPPPAPAPRSAKKARKAEVLDQVQMAAEPLYDEDDTTDGGARPSTAFYAVPSSAAPPPPPPMPQAMPARAKGGPLSAAAGAIGGMFAGSVPAPSGAPAPAARAPAPPPADAGLDVGEALLDYGNLRLAGWAAPAGQRGRLRAGDLADLAAESGVPAAARAQVTTRFSALQSAAQAATRLPLPPHHVVPGPIDDADFRWDAQDAVDVPSDGRFHSVGVFAAPLALEVSYRAVPRSDPRAFRTLVAKLSESVPLLAGPVDVFVDGALEITLPWKGSGRGADLRMGLGPEDRLRVARNVRYREETAGLLRGSRRLHTEIEVELASGLARAVEVEVLDRVPVAKGDTAEVSLVASSPTAQPWKGDPDGRVLQGGLRQVVSIPPGGKGAATLHYTVTLGGKDEIVGGDRRG